ncbi:lipocalin family protein [Falsihalocynthiibacter sp. BN13B15]|uniref:lipocalin family protein n=1 Tax=Falsihalocynthiibacter sp. BN13B15 TaxID=3240871 RepID=UPI00350FE90D
MDRKWSSQPLSDTQSGRDWFSLSFEGGSKLMEFQLRKADGSLNSSLTWIAPDGATKSYSDDSFAAEPLDTSLVEGRDVPTRWRDTLPEQGVDVTVEALNPNAWMDLSIPY